MKKNMNSKSFRLKYKPIYNTKTSPWMFHCDCSLYRNICVSAVFVLKGKKVWLIPIYSSEMCLLANYIKTFIWSIEFKVAHGLHGNVNGKKHKVGGFSGSTAMLCDKNV